MDIRLKETRWALAGETYTLRCNMNVLADVQEAFGGNISLALSEKNSVRSVTTFLCAMLNDDLDERGEARRWTPRSLGRALPPGALAEVRALVMELVAASLRSEEGDGEGTGKN